MAIGAYEVEFFLIYRNLIEYETEFFLIYRNFFVETLKISTGPTTLINSTLIYVEYHSRKRLDLIKQAATRFGIKFLVQKDF